MRSGSGPQSLQQSSEPHTEPVGPKSPAFFILVPSRLWKSLHLLLLRKYHINLFLQVCVARLIKTQVQSLTKRGKLNYWPFIFWQNILLTTNFLHCLSLALWMWFNLSVSDLYLLIFWISWNPCLSPRLLWRLQCDNRYFRKKIVNVLTYWRKMHFYITGDN